MAAAGLWRRQLDSFKQGGSSLQAVMSMRGEFPTGADEEFCGRARQRTQIRAEGEESSLMPESYRRGPSVPMHPFDDAIHNV